MNLTLKVWRQANRKPKENGNLQHGRGFTRYVFLRNDGRVE